MAIYARFSDALLQRDESVDQQITECRRYAQERNYSVVAEQVDRGKRAANWEGRTGWKEVAALATSRSIDRVVVWSINRFTRELARGFGVLAELSESGVVLEDVNGQTYDVADPGGQASAFAGMIGAELYTKQVRDAQARAHRSRAASTKLATGREPYGFRLVYDENRDANGKIVSSNPRPAVDEAEARIVRLIFREFAEGRPKQAIARHLNEDGIRSPAGKTWGPTTILALLRNEKYIGVRVFGKTLRRGKVSAITGRRAQVEVDSSDWTRQDGYVESIINRDVWNRVQERLAHDAEKHASRKAHTLARPRYLLSGLLKCDLCGGAFTVTQSRGMHSYRCGTRQQKGKAVCAGGKTVSTAAIEELVIDVVESLGKDPAALEEIVAGHNAEREASNERVQERVRRLEGERDDLQQKIAKLLNQMEAGAPTSLVARLETRESEAADIVERLRAARAEIAPRLTPTLRIEDVRLGEARVLTGDVERDRRVLDQLISTIRIDAEGLVRIVFEPTGVLVDEVAAPPRPRNRDLEALQRAAGPRARITVIDSTRPMLPATLAERRELHDLAEKVQAKFEGRVPVEVDLGGGERRVIAPTAHKEPEGDDSGCGSLDVPKGI